MTVAVGGGGGGGAPPNFFSFLLEITLRSQEILLVNDPNFNTFATVFVCFEYLGFRLSKHEESEIRQINFVDLPDLRERGSPSFDWVLMSGSSNESTMWLMSLLLLSL